MSTLHVSSHPLVADKLSRMRAESTPSSQFRTLTNELALLIMAEATATLATQAVTIRTPLASHIAQKLSQPVVLVPILRAGLGLLDGALTLLPDATVGHLGMARNEDTLQPISYYSKLPAEIASSDVFVLDPMLATGGSSSAAITEVKQAGGVRIRFICLVAAPEGVARLTEDHPDVQIYTAALDECLDDRGYVVPGLGDAGDRVFNT